MPRAPGPAAHAIAKLDRLARNARFLLHVVEGTGEAGIVFCDLPSMPPGPVGKFLLTQVAAVAELEAGLISQRTRAALAAAKARGTELGNPQLRPGAPEQARAAAARSVQARTRAADIMLYVEAARKAGARLLQESAEAPTNRGMPTPAGKGRWRPEQVKRVLARLYDVLRAVDPVIQISASQAHAALSGQQEAKIEVARKSADMGLPSPQGPASDR